MLFLFCVFIPLSRISFLLWRQTNMKKSPDLAKVIAGIAAVILLVIVIGGGGAWFDRRESRSAQARESSTEEESAVEAQESSVYLDEQVYTYDHRIETFLFIGTDNSGAGEGEKYSGRMADFLLLMVLDHTDDTVGCLQIDRNTITTVYMLDDNDEIFTNRDMQICVANMYGSRPEVSAENTAEAVKYFLGDLERIDGYYIMNMGDIRTLNRVVGGVEITVQEDMTAVDPAFTVGAKLTLSDEQAERFVRSRMSLADSTNENRMGRQTQYMSALFDKVRAHTASNPGYGLELFENLRSCAVTNMTGMDFSRIARMLLKGRDKGILRLKGETKVGRVLDDGQEHEEFYPEMESVIDIMTELFTLVPEDE